MTIATRRAGDQRARAVSLLVPITLLLLIVLVAGCGHKNTSETQKTEENVAGRTPSGDEMGDKSLGNPPIEKPSAPRTATVAAGTAFVGTLQTSVDTGKNKVGDRVSVRTTESVSAGGATAFPAGSIVN